MRSLIILLLTVMVNFISLAHADDVAATKPLRIIMKGIYASGWLPSTDEVAAAEQALKVTFEKASTQLTNYRYKASPFSDYTLRFSGVVGSGGSEQGVRLIAVDGFCHNSMISEAWIREGGLVRDGGACYFSGMFDPKKQQFVRFYFNGPA